MFNILKKNYIELHFYTFHNDILEYASIKRSSDFYPEWWKDIPKNYNSDLKKTMKSCYGFLELYKNSFMIPMWSDFLCLTNNRECSMSFPDRAWEANVHSPDQYGNFLTSEYEKVVKFACPWRAEASEELKVIFVPAAFNQSNKDTFSYKFLPGINNFKFNHECNLFAVLNLTKERILIEYGTPVMHIVPLTTKKIKTFFHSDKEKFDKLLVPRLSFIHQMHKKIKFKKSQCPFHFGKEK